MSHRLLQEEVLCGPIPRSMYNIREEKSPVNEQNAPISDFPWWHSGWESACQCRGHGLGPWPGSIPHATEQRGPRATTTESPSAAIIEPAAATGAGTPRACALHQEKPPQ